MHSLQCRTVYCEVKEYNMQQGCSTVHNARGCLKENNSWGDLCRCAKRVAVSIPDLLRWLPLELDRVTGRMRFLQHLKNSCLTGSKPASHVVWRQEAEVGGGCLHWQAEFLFYSECVKITAFQRYLYF